MGQDIQAAEMILGFCDSTRAPRADTAAIEAGSLQPAPPALPSFRSAAATRAPLCVWNSGAAGQSARFHVSSRPPCDLGVAFLHGDPPWGACLVEMSLR